MTELKINTDFTRHKDQMKYPLSGDGILIRDGEQFLISSKDDMVWVFPGSTLIDIKEKTATLFTIKDVVFDIRRK